MTFASEIEKHDNERFFLVQVTARKDIGLGTNVSGNDYEFTVDASLNISEVYVNGLAETWSLDGSTLTVTSASDLESSANYTIIDHEIYLTGSTTRYTESVAGLPDAEWVPRLQNYPAVSQSVSNILNGVFTLSASQIKIISTDGYHQKLLSTNDSLSKAPVKIWACVNGLENNRLVFIGSVTTAYFSNSVLTLDIIDTFNKLNDTAFFGTTEQAVNYLGNSSRPYVAPEDNNTAVPLTIGNASPFSIAPGWRHLDAFGTPQQGQFYHISKGTKAIKYSPELPTPSSTISYSAGRILASDLLRLSFGTINDAYAQHVTRTIPADATRPSSTVLIYEKIIYLFCSSFNCQVGDFVPNIDGSGKHGWVCQTGNISFGSFNVAIAVPYYGSSTAINTIPSDGTMSPFPTISNGVHPAMSVWMEGGDQVSNVDIFISGGLSPDNRYTYHGTRYLPFIASLSAYTYAGRAINHVNFTVDPNDAGLLDTQNGSANSNPLANKNVYYKYRLASEDTHATGLKYFLTAAGMSTNAASFTQADTDLPSTNLALTTPLDSGKNHNTFLDLCQAVTRSTFGVLSVNTSQEVEYKVVDTIVTPDFERNDIDIINNSVSSKIEYQDITTSFLFNHPQIETPSFAGGISVTASVESAYSSFLHRVSKFTEIKHYLINLTGITARISGYLKNAIVEYNITTASKDLNTSIGDSVELTNSAVTNDSGTSTGIVVGIDASTTSTNLKINELRGV
jgi:hypothetical protein